MELKNNIIKILTEHLNKQKKLNENIQLADKIYFKTGKLSEDDRKIILNVTKGNNYTKIISDFLYYFKQTHVNEQELIKKLKVLYDYILNYNKNVYPIIGYNVYNISNISEIIYALQKRGEIIEEIKKLPSVAIRNLKEDIRKERTYEQLNKYYNDLQYFITHYSLLSNRPKDIQIKVLQKMFKGGTTLDQLMRFVDDKLNFIGGVDFTKQDVKKLAEIEDFEIIYEKNNVMIVRVDSPDGIKAIGCNSLWCFTYGSGFDSAYRQWSQYSYNNMVYVLINFEKKSDSEDFMHVLIKPLTDYDGNLIKYDGSDEWDENDYPIYNMSNDNYYDPYLILKDLFGKNYKKIIYNYLNFNY